MGAEMYPALEIYWKRSHDPELEVRECLGRPPSAFNGSKLVKSYNLAQFSYDQLHLLMSCKRFSPTVSPSASECAALEREYERQTGWGFLFPSALSTEELLYALAKLAIAALLAKWAHGLGWHRRLLRLLAEKCPGAAAMAVALRARALSGEAAQRAAGKRDRELPPTEVGAPTQEP